MSVGGRVLISWVARQNDPFEREQRSEKYREVNNARVPGPTLSLLFDDESPFKGHIRDIVLLHRQSPEDSASLEQRALQETTLEIRSRLPEARVEQVAWHGDDPTDHRAIFEFLRQTVPELRKRYKDQELIIHASPGTPSMQTVWVLMAETGFVDAPFQLVKSYRKEERRGRPAVVPIEVGIETFYKRYKASYPSQVASEEQALPWDPARFQSQVLKKLYTEARRFAHLQVPVLILGERGTGKTTLANWMRLHSPYRREEQDERWPAVACGQYTPETMRAELFGHLKGAFTDAVTDRPGLLAAADGDTLFLDEVGDISRDLQRLLIKALEEKRYVRLGDDKPSKSDFRLLTATNLPMTKLRERLDPDFLDRIGLLRLRLPPLRDVPEDMSWLWETMYQRAAQRSGVSAKQARLGNEHHERIVRVLRKHPLPGNLRDLLCVAYRLLAARSDPHEPLSVEDAVSYALAELDAGGSVDEEVDLAREVAHAFALSQPLGAVLRPGVRLSMEDLDRELKLYVARELKRVASERHIDVETLCDVTEKSLRNWVKDGERKRSSGGPEE
jgi:DNA-binding NtrC family response regulator